MRIFAFLKYLSLVSAVVAQEWSGTVVKRGKGKRRNRVICSGAFVANNWFLTDLSCIVDPSKHVIRNGGELSPVVSLVPNNDDYALLVKTEFSKAPETTTLASEEFPYESEGQMVKFTYYRRGKPRARMRQLKRCIDEFCIGEKESGTRCQFRKGYPVQIDNDEKPTIMGIIKDGGCFTKKFVFNVTPVRKLRNWVESVTGESLDESPQLCN